MPEKDEKALGFLSRMRMGWFGGGNKESSGGASEADKNFDAKAAKDQAEKDRLAKMKEQQLKDRNKPVEDHYGSDPKKRAGGTGGVGGSGGIDPTA